MQNLVNLEIAISKLCEALKKPDARASELRAFLFIAKSSMENDPLNTESLRSVLRMSEQTSSDIVKLLVRSDLVTKQTDPEDRRAKLLHLTEHGQRCINYITYASNREAT